MYIERLLSMKDLRVTLTYHQTVVSQQALLKSKSTLLQEDPGRGSACFLPGSASEAPIGRPRKCPMCIQGPRRAVDCSVCVTEG